MSVGVGPDKDARPIRCGYRNPRLIGVVQPLLVWSECVRNFVLAVACPETDPLDRLTKSIQFFVLPPVVTGPNATEVPLEQATETRETMRAVHRNKIALDLALQTCRATVLLLVYYACLGVQHDIQPTVACHAVWIKTHISLSNHGGAHFRAAASCSRWARAGSTRARSAVPSGRCSECSTSPCSWTWCTRSPRS